MIFWDAEAIVKVLLWLHLAENVIFGSTSPDCIGIARFACQFNQSPSYLTSHLELIERILLAGSLLPQTQCLEGEQTRFFFLLNELEKGWIMRQLYLDWDGLSIADARDGLQKLWNSEMGKEDYADFLESLPLF